MAPMGPKRRPRFFWQGMLILLPVVVMAGIALVALVQDRAAAEREAKRRAEEALQQLGNGFEQRMGYQLSLVSLGSGGPHNLLWSQEHLADTALWPTSVWRQEREKARQAQPDTNAATEAVYAELARASGLRPEEFMVPGLVFDTAGRLLEPPEWARLPQPPTWLLELNQAQREAFQALESRILSSTNAAEVKKASIRLEATDAITPPIMENTEFFRLQSLLADAPAASAVQQWLEFAHKYGWELQAGPFFLFNQKPFQGEELSESGVPLSSLVVAKALQRAAAIGPTEPLWTALVREVGWAPSAFTPVLLDLAEPLTQRRPELRPCLQALRWRWAATERAWDLADAIRHSGGLQGITSTNLWLDFQGTRWLCLLQAEPGYQRWNQNNVQSTTTNWFMQVRLCPKVLVEQALRQVAQESRLSLPPYLGVTAELAGEPLGPAPGNKPELTLAQLQGRLACPGRTVGPQGEVMGIEAMPSRPPFTLQVALVDRAQLFAAQRRRIWLFGALVLAAALTAAVGFAAAYRSFQRQLWLSELKSNFVSSVSHELRAPISSVRLMAESLERGKIAEPGKQREYFHFIGQECRRLSSLIENVLDFSRIEQNRKQYEFEPTDLVALTQQTVKLMETYAEEKGVTLRLQLPEEVSSPGPQVSSLKLQPVLDGKAIQQALVNLIDNAVKHSPKGEQVTIGLEVTGSEGGREQRSEASSSRSTHHALHITLWVQDHGPGIPATEHERIFERFYRLGSELRRETQGVGIGLSIVKHVVAAHGGTVHVQSEVGRGSRFRIELPMTPDEAEAEGRNPRAE